MLRICRRLVLLTACAGALLGALWPLSAAQAQEPSAWASVRDYGARGDARTDDTAAFKQAMRANAAVDVPPGVYLLSDTLILRAHTHLRGAGTGVSTLVMAAGANKTILETQSFAELRGTARLAQAPSDIHVSGLTLNGGFLAGKWNAPERRVTNSQGNCLSLYARRVSVKVEANNCAAHMLYSEGQGPRDSEEVASDYHLTGMGAGEECVVFRGPGDSMLEFLRVGLCGLKRLNKATQHERSHEYPLEPGYDGLVIDRQKPYEGTLELGFAHVFACFSGWGVRTLGNPRFNAVHLISESNLGGVRLSQGTWGGVTVLDVHSNGKGGSGGPSDAPREGLWLESSAGFSVEQALIARTGGGAQGFLGARISGSGNRVNLIVSNTRDPLTNKDFTGEAVALTGGLNQLTVLSARQQGVAARVTGAYNQVTVTTPAQVLDTGSGNEVHRVGPAPSPQ